jgi:hypothetical protein
MRRSPVAEAAFFFMLLGLLLLWEALRHPARAYRAARALWRFWRG